MYKILQDTEKIYMVTLCMSNTTSIWWESWAQANFIQHGKIISSWVEFTNALRNQFYPLPYIQTMLINWQHLRQVKEKNVQGYT